MPSESKPNAARVPIERRAETLAESDSPTTSRSTPAGGLSFEQRRRLLIKAVAGEIEPVKVTSSYTISLFLVGFGMLLLATIYFVIALVGIPFAVWWITHPPVMPAGQKISLGGIVVWLLPAMIGLVVPLFLLKPLFAPASSQSKPRRLKRDAEPLLFDYIDRICDAVGAPRPASIRIDLEVNASASFRRGLISFFGDDLTLTLGLPLIAGLNARQFSGVLAHEFGHFAQRTGLRMSSLIMRVNFWFLRFVFERDGWDERLERWQATSSGWAFAVLWCLNKTLWVSRWCVFGLSWLGRAMSGWLTRQMEFDADLHEIRFSGSKCFASTCRRLRELNVAHIFAMHHLQQAYQDGRLVDDWSGMIAANLDEVTPETRKLLRIDEQKTRTGALDTHPCDYDRIAQADDEQAPGIFQGPKIGESHEELPAAALFSDFKRLCQVVTLEFYRELFRKKIKRETLHSVEAMIERRNSEKEAGKALARYFQVEIPVMHALPLSRDAFRKPDSAKETAARMSAARKAMLEEVESYKQLIERYSTARKSHFLAATATAMLEAKCRIDIAKFELRKPGLSFAEDKRERAKEGVEHLAGRMLPFEQAAGERLSFALQLLHVSKVIDTVPNGADLAVEALTLLPAALFVTGLMAELPTLQILFQRTLILFGHIDEANRQNQDFVESLIETVGALRKRLKSIHKEMGDYIYPLDHQKRNITIREFALPYIPDEDAWGEMLSVADGLMSKLVVVQLRLFARLAKIAEQVESALGLPPLPEPKDEKRKKPKVE